MRSRIARGVCLGVLTLGLAVCSEDSDFQHDFEFKEDTGNTGYSKEHKYDKPQTPFAFTVRVDGTDAVEPEDVQVSANLACQTGPSFSGSFPVTLTQAGLRTLEGSFSRTAAECVDAESGQNGIAVWTVSVARINTTLAFKVIINGA